MRHSHRLSKARTASSNHVEQFGLVLRATNCVVRLMLEVFIRLGCTDVNFVNYFVSCPVISSNLFIQQTFLVRHLPVVPIPVLHIQRRPTPHRNLKTKSTSLQKTENQLQVGQLS